MPTTTVSTRLQAARRRVTGAVGAGVTVVLGADATIVLDDWRRNTALDFTNLYEFTGEECASYPRRRLFA